MALTVVAAPKLTVLPKSNEAAESVTGLVNDTGPTKLSAPALLRLPSIVAGPVPSKRSIYAAPPVETELAKRKVSKPLFMLVSASKVMFVSLRPNKMALSLLLNVPAKSMPLGAVATKPPAKYMSSEATAPNFT